MVLRAEMEGSEQALIVSCGDGFTLDDLVSYT